MYLSGHRQTGTMTDQERWRAISARTPRARHYVVTLESPADLYLIIPLPVQALPTQVGVCEGGSADRKSLCQEMGLGWDIRMCSDLDRPIQWRVP